MSAVPSVVPSLIASPSTEVSTTVVPARLTDQESTPPTSDTVILLLPSGDVAVMAASAAAASPAPTRPSEAAPTVTAAPLRIPRRDSAPGRAVPCGSGYS